MNGLAFVLSVLIGVSLGMLGGGGSILTTPVLMYALGVEPKQAIATSLLVVAVTSLVGVVRHALAGNVVWKIGLLFGAAGMVGAYLGGSVANYLPDNVLLGLFAVTMFVVAGAMLRGRKDPGARAPVEPVIWKVLLQGALVGAFAGLVGAGGGFLVVPALVLAGGLAMPKAIGTSLLVITLQSFAGYAGHAAHVSIDYGLAAFVSVAAVVGVLGGSLLAGKVAPVHLRRGFGVFVLFMACFVLYQQL